MRHVSPTWGEAHLPHHVRWKTFGLMLCVSLVGPLPRHALLPLLRPLDAVRSVTQLLKLSSGLGLANGLERFLERFPGPPCPVPRLASQDLVRHVGHPLLLFHGLLLPGGSSVAGCTLRPFSFLSVSRPVAPHAPPILRIPFRPPGALDDRPSPLPSLDAKTQARLFGRLF